jgi:hypothetical protein
MEDIIDATGAATKHLRCGNFMENFLWQVERITHQGVFFYPFLSAMRDHDRARLFKDYGLFYIEFYDAAMCYNDPDRVVDDFLNRLLKL